MAYITESNLTAKIPPQTLLDALDDDGDGAADEGVLDEIIASASLEIDNELSGRHVVPFTGDIPPTVKFACLIFVLEMLYKRRGWTGENNRNPWSAEARALRSQLREIGMGTRPLFPAADKATKNTGYIGEDSRIVGEGGYLDA